MWSASAIPCGCRKHHVVSPILRRPPIVTCFYECAHRVALARSVESGVPRLADGDQRSADRLLFVEVG